MQFVRLKKLTTDEEAVFYETSVQVHKISKAIRMPIDFQRQNNSRADILTAQNAKLIQPERE